MKTEKEIINWQVLPSFALVALREELETAWLRGAWAHFVEEDRVHWSGYEQMAADYAERVVGGSTRPASPDPLSTPSKDENAS